MILRVGGSLKNQEQNIIKWIYGKRSKAIDTQPLKIVSRRCCCFFYFFFIVYSMPRLLALGLDSVTSYISLACLLVKQMGDEA